LVGEVLASAGRLRVLLGDVLDFNALEAGQVKAARLPFSPAGVARRAADAIRPAAQAKGLGLTVTLDECAETEAVGDPDHLGQVLDHLLDNAVKFTAAGGVTLSLSRDRPGEEDGDNWRFEVIDTGVGLDPATAERLFASFEVADASTTRAHGGAGLGLAICRRLAGLMGGRVEVDGEPGNGARFALIVPLGSQA